MLSSEFADLEHIFLSANYGNLARNLLENALCLRKTSFFFIFFVTRLSDVIRFCYFLAETYPRNLQRASDYFNYLLKLAVLSAEDQLYSQLELLSSAYRSTYDLLGTLPLASFLIVKYCADSRISSDIS